jgi:hypothetical protein
LPILLATRFRAAITAVDSATPTAWKIQPNMEKLKFE